MPPMQNAALSAKMQTLDAIYQAEAMATGATYVSSWTLLGTPRASSRPTSSPTARR